MTHFHAISHSFAISLPSSLRHKIHAIAAWRILPLLVFVYQEHLFRSTLLGDTSMVLQRATYPHAKERQTPRMHANPLVHARGVVERHGGAHLSKRASVSRHVDVRFLAHRWTFGWVDGSTLILTWCHLHRTQVRKQNRWEGV